ncbi:TRAP transporter substrate-binding protein [Sedimentibacter sp. MB31-C6]|uniref:TRAP transporter substrate-binding protein n=1 Tax=Sedimentibacter sp. MB31-C6 TaxID=3109366 RepID=UPI002DDDA4AD|nr:TRAP transporter substrate-binding protein [Sedimentibacter sp. MB36-C1]WSI04879.1 TRAP transporter substrate-binding protein [Sedimentibacter sp. MB36-C1]
MKIKKILGTLVAVSMIASLVACGGNEAPAEGDNTSKGTSDDVKTITFAHVSAESTSTHQAALKFKEVVEANSNGQLEVNVYPTGQLGGDRELIENTQNGSITAMVSSPAPQVNFVKSATIFDSPFVFEGLEHGRAVLDDANFMSAIAAEYENSGFHYFGASGQGFRTLTCNDKITTLEQLKGLTIRTMENKYHMQTWELLGANPTPLTFNELYTALQQGTVAAQENPVELVHAQKFYEQQKYVVDTNHILQVNTWIMNKDFYDGLSDELKAVVDDAGRQAVEVANRINDEKEPGYIEVIEDYGTEFVEVPAEEKAKIVEAVAPVYEEIKSATAPAVYDAYFNAIEEYKTK